MERFYDVTGMACVLNPQTLALYPAIGVWLVMNPRFRPEPYATLLWLTFSATCLSRATPGEPQGAPGADHVQAAPR